MADSWLKTHILRIVERIPKGKVATYTQIAELTGQPNHDVHVSRYLKEEMTSGTRLPWFRVVRTKKPFEKGELADYHKEGNPFHDQKRKLEAEGVIFEGNRIDLKKYQCFKNELQP